MYLCIDILPNRIESILSYLYYILICYSFYASVSGTDCTRRGECPGLSRDFFARVIPRSFQVLEGIRNETPLAVRRRGGSIQSFFNV